MKLAASIFFLLLFAPSAFAAEQIASFTSDIQLKQDGTFTVVETVAYDFDEAERHGIFRQIDTKHPQDARSFLKTRHIGLEVMDVSMDGNAVPFEVTDSLSHVEIKIGDEDATITGLHTYTIEYKVSGGYSYFDDGGAEVYWNATGNRWEVAMAKVLVHVHAPGGMLVQDSACYVGIEGENTSCGTIEGQEDGSILFAVTDLPAGSGLTLAQAVNGSEVAVLKLERANFFLFFVVLIPILGIALLIFGYRYRTKHKTGNSIVAQYEPYKNFKPMYAGMLFDGRLDPRDITAGIVYLAEQGFIKIKKRERKVLFLFEVDDYEIKLVRPIAEIESPHLKAALMLLFKEDTQVQDTITLSDLKKDLAQQRGNARKLTALRAALTEDIRADGFFEVNASTVKLLLAIVLCALLILAFALSSLATLFFILLIFVCGMAILIIMYERRTKAGYEALDHLKGFKLFLSVTDTERFTFHNAPQKSPEQFMKYLPYAIAFKVEKEWAKVFEDIAIPEPDWYEGSTAGSFSAVHLTSSLGAFSTSFSASSGSSGSSGGGSSGGGGGGGGGGSW